MKKYFLLVLAAAAAFSCSGPLKEKKTFSLTNENVDILSKYVDYGVKHSGNVSYKVTEFNEYGPTWRYNEDELSLAGADSVIVSFKFKAETISDSVLFVYSTESSIEANKDWQSSKFVNSDPSVEWQSIDLAFKLKGTQFAKEDLHSFYLWNIDKHNFYVDDVEISVIDIKEN